MFGASHLTLGLDDHRRRLLKIAPEPARHGSWHRHQRIIRENIIHRAMAEEEGVGGNATTSHCPVALQFVRPQEARPSKMLYVGTYHCTEYNETNRCCHMYGTIVASSSSSM